MGLLGWIFIGFVAGFVARVVVRPGRSYGCLGTIALGLAGSIVGGTVGNLLTNDGLDLAVSGMVGSILGAIGILAFLRITGRTDGTAHRPLR
ncbi:MAG: GlsB/YeaQ/YmgE family stress response membrane protein [Acidimicrobiales bacterium]|nr:GlsB/YeaQ/YmgE family stress response membrane protein [Acidimicrobiales bacterium]